MSKENELLQINISRILVLIIIITLLHSLYLLNVDEKNVKGEATISNVSKKKQSLLNKLVILIVTTVYLILQYNNYLKLKNSGADKEKLNKQIATVIILILAFLSILIDTIIGYNEYKSALGSSIN